MRGHITATLVETKEGSKKVRFFSYEEAPDYADFCLRMTIVHGGSQQTWMMEKDKLTRGKLCTYMRRGYTGTEALALAWQETDILGLALRHDPAD